MRRKILWLSHFLPWPPKGGLKQRSYHLLRELSKHHDINMVALRQRAHQPDHDALTDALNALAPLATVSHVSDLPTDSMTGGASVLALRSLLPGLPYTIRWGLSDTYSTAVGKALAEFGPDIVHFDTVSLAPYLDLTDSKTPAVLNHHNIESHMLLRRAQLERNLLKKLYFAQEGQRLATYERKIAERFMLHLVCSDTDMQRLKQSSQRSAIKVVPNGADLDYFRPVPDTPQKPDSMIFVGGLSWYPNASAMRHFLQDIWPLITAQRPSASIHIVGANAPPDIRDAAARDNRIKAPGFVDDIRPLVAESMVYVCPIFDGGGTKLKMIDAMAMGKAIVAHPTAAEGLGLQHGKHALLHADSQDIAGACLQLFDNPSLRASLGAAARKRAEHAFGFSAIGRDLAMTYSQLTHTPS